MCAYFVRLCKVHHEASFFKHCPYDQVGSNLRQGIANIPQHLRIIYEYQINTLQGVIIILNFHGRREAGRSDVKAMKSLLTKFLGIHFLVVRDRTEEGSYRVNQLSERQGKHDKIFLAGWIISEKEMMPQNQD